MASSPYYAVFIDFYGTLAAGDAEIVARVCRNIREVHALPVSEVALAESWGRCFFRAVDRANRNGFRSLYTLECETLVKTLEPWCGVIDPEPHVAELTAYWREPPLHSDARPALQSLDVPVCCVSNADDSDLAHAVRHHGLEFDLVVSSESAECYKPGARIFEVALQTLGVDPQRVLHVGDSLHSDVGGAKQCGIGSAWLRRDERIYDIGRAEPDHKLSSLNELRVILSAAGP